MASEKMRKRAYSKKVRPTVIEMYRAGCRQKDIARSLGLSRYQVYRITGTCNFFMPEAPAEFSDTQFDEDDDLLSPKMSNRAFVKARDRQKQLVSAIGEILETVKMSRNKRFQINFFLEKLKNL